MFDTLVLYYCFLFEYIANMPKLLLLLRLFTMLLIGADASSKVDSKNSKAPLKGGRFSFLSSYNLPSIKKFLPRSNEPATNRRFTVGSATEGTEMGVSMEPQRKRSFCESSKDAILSSFINNEENGFDSSSDDSNSESTLSTTLTGRASGETMSASTLLSDTVAQIPEFHQETANVAVNAVEADGRRPPTERASSESGNLSKPGSVHSFVNLEQLSDFTDEFEIIHPEDRILMILDEELSKILKEDAVQKDFEALLGLVAEQNKQGFILLMRDLLLGIGKSILNSMSLRSSNLKFLHPISKPVQQQDYSFSAFHQSLSGPVRSARRNSPTLPTLESLLAIFERFKHENPTDAETIVSDCNRIRLSFVQFDQDHNGMAVPNQLNLKERLAIVLAYVCSRKDLGARSSFQYVQGFHEAVCYFVIKFSLSEAAVLADLFSKQFLKELGSQNDIESAVKIIDLRGVQLISLCLKSYKDKLDQLNETQAEVASAGGEANDSLPSGPAESASSSYFKNLAENSDRVVRILSFLRGCTVSAHQAPVCFMKYVDSWSDLQEFISFLVFEVPVSDREMAVSLLSGAAIVHKLHLLDSIIQCCIGQELWKTFVETDESTGNVDTQEQFLKEHQQLTSGCLNLALSQGVQEIMKDWQNYLGTLRQMMPLMPSLRYHFEEMDSEEEEYEEEEESDNESIGENNYENTYCFIESSTAPIGSEAMY